MGNSGGKCATTQRTEPRNSRNPGFTTLRYGFRYHLGKTHKSVGSPNLGSPGAPGRPPHAGGPRASARGCCSRDAIRGVSLRYTPCHLQSDAFFGILTLRFPSLSILTSHLTSHLTSSHLSSHLSSLISPLILSSLMSLITHLYSSFHPLSSSLAIRPATRFRVWGDG